MLKEKLSFEAQQEILNELFGFCFEGEPGHYVLYDEEGDKIDYFSGNNKLDFSTLEGIFAYTAFRAKNQGYADAQKDIRKAIGLN